MPNKQMLVDLDFEFPIENDTQILIACGYFDASTGVDDFALESLKAGLMLGSDLQSEHSLRKTPLYTIIVNDLGMDCSQDVCDARSRNAPAEIDMSTLEEICDSSNASFSILRERTLRNRSARLLKRWLRDSSTDETLRLDGGDILFESFIYPKVVAGAVNPAGAGIPRCPLIVSEYLDLSFKQLSAVKQSSARIVIDFNHVADKDKVIKGSEMYLARRSRGHEAVVQVFFDPNTHDSVSLSYSSYDLGRKIA